VIGLSASRHALVDRHFARQSSAAEDRRLFAHLPRCPTCRTRYRTHSLLEGLEPDAPLRVQHRLAPAVFGPRPKWRAPPRDLLFFGGLGLAAATALVLIARPAAPPFGGDDAASGFQPRGQERAGEGTAGTPFGAEALVPSLEVFRVPPAGAPVRAGAVVHSQDGLAFSYRNPPQGGGWSFLLVFARAPSGRVFWYWPAWLDSTQRPSAVAIQTTGVPVELGESVRHPLPPGPVELFGLFAHQPYTVQDIEAALAEGEAGLARLDAAVWRESLEVLP